MPEPKKVTIYPTAIKFEVQCPWCDNQMFLTIPWDDVDGEEIYDCDQCHKPYILGEVG